MTKKTKYNPSGYPVLSKSRNNKGAFLKSLEQNKKRLNKLLAKGGKGK